MVILPKFEILRHNLLGQLKLVILFVFRICSTCSRNIFEASLYTYRSFSLSDGPKALYKILFSSAGLLMERSIIHKIGLNISEKSTRFRPFGLDLTKFLGLFQNNWVICDQLNSRNEINPLKRVCFATKPPMIMAHPSIPCLTLSK